MWWWAWDIHCLSLNSSHAGGNERGHGTCVCMMGSCACHSGMELLSTSNPTLNLVFKHWLLIWSWISILSSMIIIEQPWYHSHWLPCPPITSSHNSLNWIKSLDSQIQSYISKSLLNHSSLFNLPFNVSSAPSWHSLLFLSSHSMTTPSFPIFLPTHSFLHVDDPRDLII